MSQFTANFYDYLEERPFTSNRMPRRGSTDAVRDPVLGKESNERFRGSLYCTTYRQMIEDETFDLPEKDNGGWTITGFRAMRHVGDPGRTLWPHTDPAEHRAVYPSDILPRLRLHHYYRIYNAAECIKFGDPNNGCAVSLEIELTEEWHDPPNGRIDRIPISSPVLSTHAVGVVHWNKDERAFLFPNSWGDEWGNNAWGAISRDVFDRYMCEAWCMVGTGLYPPIRTTTGLVVLCWKSSATGKEVHGREIVDTSSGDRIGWCFLTLREGYVDIEELFVWPHFRRCGYGRMLAMLAKEFAEEKGIPLRAIIGFSDADPAKRDRLVAFLNILDLKLHPSPYRGVAFVAVSAPYSIITEPYFPRKPSSPQFKLDPQNGTRLYTVWYATNRIPRDPGRAELGFTRWRDDHVHYGKCDVAIPIGHRFGSVGSGFFKRWARLADDRLRVVEIHPIKTGEFWCQIDGELSACDMGERQILVYIHGYRNHFKEAAVRAAQIGFDLRFPGITTFFSWPSLGAYVGYSADEATISASESHLTAFLCDLAVQTQAEKIHLIAHSMGNLGLLRALQRIASDTSHHTGVRFGQIILAAPDIDRDLFIDLARLFPHFGERTTLYASPADYAVFLSKYKHIGHRAGYTPPVTVVSGVDTIEIPKFNILDLGHAYFAEAEGLLNDMFQLIRHGLGPEERQRLSPAESSNGTRYWTMDL